MWQFIISGYIPGTETQLNFESILIFAGSFTVSVLLAILIQSLHAQSLEIVDQIRPLDEVAL